MNPNTSTRDISALKKSFLTQHDQSDCGVACLHNIIKYHGGEVKLEKLRELSGTNRTGTTMLGLYQAAAQCGFEAEGLQAGIDYLKRVDAPVVLHVTIDGKYQHYLVLYRYDNGKFIIGDPSRGIREMAAEELERIWISKSLLRLKLLNGAFKKKEAGKKEMLQWFLEIIKEDTTILTTILLTGIVVSILGIAIAVYSQTLIDNLIPSGDLLRIVLASVLIFLILVSRTAIGYFRQSFIIRQSRDINVRMIGKFFSRLLRQPMAFFNSRRTGDMVARLNDTGKIQQTITYITGELLINALLLIVSLAAVFVYHPPAGIILLAGIPVYYLIARHYHPVIKEKQQNVMAAHAGNESNYISTIENVQVIRSGNKEAKFADAGKTVYGFFQQQLFRLGQTGVALNAITEVTGIILIMAVVSVSIAAMLGNTMQAGEFIALLTLTNNVIPACASLAFANIHLQSARVAFERTYEISAGRPEYDREQDKSAIRINKFEHLEIKDVSFRFPGRKLLLENISIYLKKGEIKTVFGENGTGKSTLLNLIQRFYSPESGVIRVNGNDISKVSIGSFRKILGVVPQQISLFNTSILGNIVLDATPEEAEEAVGELQRHSLLPLIEQQFPHGLATIVEERGLNISGGQKKLIGLARALCRRPQLLLIDELTSSTDRQLENFIIDLIIRIKDEAPVLQVTHNLKAAAISDEIIIIENGRISSRGGHVELMQSENIYSLSFMDYFVT
ncbi:MAG: peptidase domain-containing ABC transporter [Marinilabiliales bacterium]|nr:MAG: peptidase domain-containing ABC transporter [Marinilabiliales bacterium]